MFNFNSQNPGYTFGFGGKYPDFRKRTKGIKTPAYNPPSSPSGNIIEQRVAHSKRQQGWYVGQNQAPSDIFQSYKPREATGMEQMRGKNGFLGLPYGFMGESSPDQYKPRFMMNRILR
jgi:hypothetical protein